MRNFRAQDMPKAHVEPETKTKKATSKDTDAAADSTEAKKTEKAPAKKTAAKKTTAKSDD